MVRPVIISEIESPLTLSRQKPVSVATHQIVIYWEIDRQNKQQLVPIHIKMCPCSVNKPLGLCHLPLSPGFNNQITLKPKPNPEILSIKFGLKNEK